MVITELEPTDVLPACRQILQLPDGGAMGIDDELLAALLRRCAGFLCPCSRTALRASLIECLKYLDDRDELQKRIDLVIDGLITNGDLLELSDVAADESSVKGTWVFAAPPSYIVRPGGSVFLTGIVPDQDTFLPNFLSSRISYDGCARLITPHPGEDLTQKLRDHGLQQLSNEVWLKAPRPETAAGLLGRMECLLESQFPSGAIENLRLIDPAQCVTYYRGRWVTPGNQNGTFLGWRPQEYGAPIWCFIRLTDGIPDRLLDLPVRKSRWRGCDAAWHLQMAIDSCRSNPQRYRKRRDASLLRLDFFSPLPQWSQRRFMIFGRAVPKENCLMSYVLTEAEAQTEEAFLQERLWLEPTEDSD